MNFDRALNTILYILQRLEETSKTKLLKLLFLIDIEHMAEYNRPITWDRYCRLSDGPIPSYILDVINTLIGKNAGPVSEDDLKVFSNAIEIDIKVIQGEEGAFLSPQRKVDLKEFSESETEVIDAILDKYGNKTAPELIKITHEHPVFKKSFERDIDYSDAISSEKRKEFYKIWEGELRAIRNLLN